MIWQVAIEIIYSATQCLVYTLILYSMIGFEWNIGKIFWFYYYVLMCLVYFTAYGMMGVALTPGHQIGAIFMYFFCCFWALFCGFIIPREVQNYIHLTSFYFLKLLTLFALKNMESFFLCFGFWTSNKLASCPELSVKVNYPLEFNKMLPSAQSNASKFERRRALIVT